MKEKLNQVCIYSLIISFLDQILKIFISSVVDLNKSYVLIKQFLSITLVHNKGAAFSILSGNIIFLIVIGLLALIGIIYYVKKLDYLNNIDVIIYSLLIGGVLGNLIDRIVHGYVIDYISFNFGTYLFPVFNFADICIVISIIIIIVRTIKEDLCN